MILVVYGGSLEQVFGRFWCYMEVLENRVLGDFGAIWRFSTYVFGRFAGICTRAARLPVVCGAARLLSSVFYTDFVFVLNKTRGDLGVE